MFFYMGIYIHEIDTSLLKKTLLIRKKYIYITRNVNDQIIITNQGTSKNYTIDVECE